MNICIYIVVRLLYGQLSMCYYWLWILAAMCVKAIWGGMKLWKMQATWGGMKLWIMQATRGGMELHVLLWEWWIHMHID